MDVLHRHRSPSLFVDFVTFSGPVTSDVIMPRQLRRRQIDACGFTNFTNFTSTAAFILSLD